MEDSWHILVIPVITNVLYNNTVYADEHIKKSCDPKYRPGCLLKAGLKLVTTPVRGTSTLNNRFSIRAIRRVAVTIITGVLLFSCNPSYEKLDESIFYEGPSFKLKLVRYYESAWPHYTGEVFNVMCSSMETTNFPAGIMQDPGWVHCGKWWGDRFQECCGTGRAGAT